MCVCVCARVCVYTRDIPGVYTTCMCACKCVYTRARVRKYVRMCVFVHTRVRKYVRTRTNTDTHTHTTDRWIDV